MTDLRRYTLDTVTWALTSQWSGKAGTRQDLREHAEGLVAIAEQNHVRIEALLQWIHTTSPDKEWSLAEFRGWCVRCRAESEAE